MADKSHIDRLVQDLELLKRTVEQRVQLKGLYGLCPFHEEKTASFHLYRSSIGRARFYCHGCGAKGDIFDWLRKVEKLSFSSALIRLNDELGINSESYQVSFAPPAPASRTQDSRLPEFCERDCQKYANLREDYETLLDETLKLREIAQIDEPKPGDLNLSA